MVLSSARASLKWLRTVEAGVPVMSAMSAVRYLSLIHIYGLSNLSR